MIAARVTAAVAAAACAAALSACGGGSDYRLGLDLTNAGGLRAGSLVQVGGVPVGKVKKLDLERNGHVRATLDLDGGKGPVGRDARAAIASRNLLGEKYVRLDVGDRRHPLASGAVLPAGRVEQSVDLDQILDVLGPTTRARLEVLIDEAGAGLTGQGADLNAFLHQLPPSLDKATGLLDEVVNDNRTLGDVIARSDRFISTFARERGSLARLVDTAGRASEGFAARRAALVATLGRAPAALAELRDALDEVTATAPPLGRAGRAISASAPALTHTLREVEPFRRAAAPTLAELRVASPAVAALGRQATPVVRRAEPTLGALRGFGTSLAPVSRTLGFSIDDLMAALHGWSRAIQARDGLSHMFRAKVMINPESLNSVISRLTAPATRGTAKKRPTAPAPVLRRPALPKLTPAPSRRPSPPVRIKTPALPAEPAQAVGTAVGGLLDYLLGR